MDEKGMHDLIAKYFEAVEQVSSLQAQTSIQNKPPGINDERIGWGDVDKIQQFQEQQKVIQDTITKKQDEVNRIKKQIEELITIKDKIIKVQILDEYYFEVGLLQVAMGRGATRNIKEYKLHIKRV